MQQRVSICRAMLLRPPLILMDEPFGALDVMTRERMGFALQDLWSESRNTVLFVTHSITEAVLLSDTVVVMSARPGRVSDIVTVDLPRPRTTDTLRDPRFIELSDRVRDGIESQMGGLNDERHGQQVLARPEAVRRLLPVAAFLGNRVAAGRDPGLCAAAALGDFRALRRNRFRADAGSAVTGFTTSAGLALALVSGVLLALLVVYLPMLRSIVMPLLAAFNCIPKIAIAPLFVIWFGLGYESKILLAFLLALFPIFVNSLTGLSEIESDMIDLSTPGGRIARGASSRKCA